MGGIKRYICECARHVVARITLAILQRLILFSFTQSSIHTATIDAAIKLAFAGFLRCGEFTVYCERTYV